MSPRLLLVLAALCGAPLSSGAGPLSAALLGSLQVEGLVSPLAVAAPYPRFSWRAGGAQQTYRIVVAQLYPVPATVWDSGVVPSNASWLLPYGGPAPLAPDADFLLSVTVSLAGVGLASASAPFSTAPAAARLGAAWLGFADTLRGAVVLDGAPVRRARVHATGVGCYQLFVNGRLLSSELAPGFGHAPSARAVYDSYDAAALLAPGENVVGLRLGSCKYGAFEQYCEGTPAQCNAGWAALVVDQGGGNVTTLTTGAAFAGANTSVVYENLWNGELFDARLEPDGWAAPGFRGAWPPATVVDTADRLGPLAPARGPPVARGEPVAPLSVVALPGGAFVFDLGADVAGHCGVDLAPPAGEAAAPAGAVVSLLHGEILHANGSVWNHYMPPGGTHQPGGLNQPAMNFTYVTRGRDELMAAGPRFSYFGFRYAELRGWPYASAPTRSTVSCRFVHSDLAPTAAVAFPASPRLDALQAGVLRTHLANFVSLPTDCPQREKRGWTGDAQLTARSGLLNFDGLAFYEAWHGAILDQQRIGCLPRGERAGRVGGAAGAPVRPANWACDPPAAVANLSLAQYQFGPVSDVVPREQLGMGYMIGDPSWEVAATTIPYELLTQAGDAAYVAANLDGPTSLLAFFNALGEADAASNGLITWSYLGDWVAIDTPNNKLVANVNYVMAALQAAEMAAAAGDAAAATTYLALAALLSDAVRARFWNASAAHWDAGSQSAQALCLALGIGGASVAAPAAAALERALAAAGGHLTVGASGARVLLSALHDDAGRPDLALALILQAGYPGWGYCFPAFGAAQAANQTTGAFFESWAFDDVAGGSSLNHIFKAGGVSPFLVEAALGLRVAMRPAAPPDARAPCAAAARVAALPLPWDARARVGLDCAHAAALADAVDAARGERGGTALARLRDDVARRVRAAAAAPPPPHPPHSRPAPRALEARVAMTVTAAAARAVRAARGWRATPAGNVSFAWAADAATGALRAELTAPAAAAAMTLLELPLAGLAAARASVDGGALELDVDVAAGRARVAAGDARAWAPRVLACGEGAAAARVDGRAEPRAARGVGACAPVLLLRVPAGEHVVELAAGAPARD